MHVRILGSQELLPALQLAWDVFEQEIAPTYEGEGIEGFQQFIRYDNIAPKVQEGEYIFFGAWKDEVLCGVGALQRRGHISLLFAQEEYKACGTEKLLFDAMCQYLVQVCGIQKVTVHAAVNRVEAYRQYGMCVLAPQQHVNGVCFVPMEMKLTKKKKKHRKWWIIFAVIALIICIFAGIFWFVIFGSVLAIKQEDICTPYEYEEEYGMDAFDSETEEEEAESGMDAIPEYISEETVYELTEDSYVLNPQEAGTSRTTIAFEIKYPQINGLEETIAEKVNEELKACAMETAEWIYLNPTDEIKERVLGEEYPVLVSYVEYKVTYLSDTFVSVVYQDYCYEGSQEAYYLRFRTRNIDLTDGTIYEVKDIVSLDESFIQEWKELMRKEAQSEELLSELEDEEWMEVLAGNELGGVYTDNFFVDKDGIEIGLGFTYAADDENNLGFSWVTAPFEWKDMKEYQTDSKFWELAE